VWLSAAESPEAESVVPPSVGFLMKAHTHGVAHGIQETGVVRGESAGGDLESVGYSD
jgi:hypothetical protein